VKRIIIALLVAVIGASAYAAEEKKDILKSIIDTAVSPIETLLGPVTDLGKIIVSPTKTEEKLVASSSSITTIDPETAIKYGEVRVEDGLRDVSAIDVAENGVPGPVSVFIRGANSNYTLVMMDGVKLYDPISPSGAYDFTDLTLDNLGRFEVIRGNQSALYGSDAIGGVIDLETRKAMNNFVNLQFDGGSFYTTHEVAEAGAYVQRFHFTVGASQYNTKSISQARAKANNPERDPYDRTSVSARVDYDLTDKFVVGGTFRGMISHSKYDSFGQDAPSICYRHENHLFTGYVDQELLDWWRYKINLGWMISLRRDYDDPNGPQTNYLRDYYSGKYFKLDYQNTFNIMDIDSVVIGYEYMKEYGSSYRDSNGAVTIMPKVWDTDNSLYLENRFNYNDRLMATQGMRVDKYSLAGTHVTYKLDGAYLLPTATKVRGCFATGFKAPTLYQLNAPANPGVVWFGTLWGANGGGNPNLQPETSTTYEYGVDQFIYGEKCVASVVYFQNRFYNMINQTMDAFWNTSQYANMGKAYAYGIEAELELKPLDILSASMSYTWMRTKDFSTDSELLRRANNKFKAQISWKVCPRFEADFIVRYVGPRMDWGNDKLKEYTVANAALNYELTKNFTMFADLQNILNKEYEEVRGNGEPGFAAYGGVRAKF
jgi:vitamin B12 transporter